MVFDRNQEGKRAYVSDRIGTLSEIGAVSELGRGIRFVVAFCFEVQ